MKKFICTAGSVGLFRSENDEDQKVYKLEMPDNNEGYKLLQFESKEQAEEVCKGAYKLYKETFKVERV